MKRVAIVASFVAVLLSVAVVAIAQDKPAAANGWTVAQKVEIKDTKLPKEWSVLAGDAEVKDGAIIMRAARANARSS